ncbi:NUDIX domain-containing protein [Streptomyces zagrosensis]|uniref:ADP-ribose pyrophosphatase YjhB (NUDIX family) n=1 Tax=Streptomyces zagrosensis TaxID=1042984 RepID=A0A7W9Q760_9ACTN|nr:NUDIX domain-containing protein [Streptomyces zagrosensis]MBB5934871.1 ADP-ribose pyrophosphatase YjhB (NUDIX family) [Streptomyces zagrosensis]
MNSADVNPNRLPPPLDVGASVLLTGPQDSVLMVLVSYGDAKWHLPGGARARDEAPQKAAERRLMRETNIRRTVRDVLALDYRTASSAEDKGEGLHIVYDGGTLTDEEASNLSLPERARAAHREIGLIPSSHLYEQCSPRIAERVTQALSSRRQRRYLPLLIDGKSSPRST